jgi:NADH-quinone oxidoreductase subunit C
MIELLQNFTAQIKDHFGDAVHSVTEFRDDVIITVAKQSIVPACPFQLCEDVFGIDQATRKNRFEVNYHFFSVTQKVRLHLKVQLNEDEQVPSITSVYPGANWPEREAYDMYGIEFSGHPDLRRMYMPEDYEHFPLRKDFPMMGIPGSMPLPKR